MRSCCCASSLLRCSRSAPRAAPRSQRRPHPSLVVLVTIDQFRADYLERFGPQLTGGLARLMRGGAWFTDAHHDHAITETAPGHATLLCRPLPALDRHHDEQHRRAGRARAADRRRRRTRRVAAAVQRYDARRLAARRRSPQSRALSVSMKDRAAILPDRPLEEPRSTGIRPTAASRRAATIATRFRRWVTALQRRGFRSGYGRQGPGTCCLPDSAYHERDSVSAEGAGTRLHLPASPARPTRSTAAEPGPRDAVHRRAHRRVRAGRRAGARSWARARSTDLLAVSLSATDVIGHRLRAGLAGDSRPGAARRPRRWACSSIRSTSCAIRRRVTWCSRRITASAPSPSWRRHSEPMPRARRPRRRCSIPVRASLTRGQTRHRRVLDIEQPVVLADRDAPCAALAQCRLRARRACRRPARQPGDRARRSRSKHCSPIRCAIPSRVAGATSSRRMRRIELVITLTPLSTWGGNVASHGSPYDYDSHVPLIFYGAGVQPGRARRVRATRRPRADARRLLGVKPMEPIDGVPLRAALH